MGDIHSTVNPSQVTVGNELRRLVADTNLESSRAPVDKLDGPLGLDAGNGTLNLLGHDVSTVQQTGGHVLSVAGVALDHLVVGLEAGVGDLLDRVRLMGGLGRRDDGGVGHEREVDTGVGYQVGLELIEIDVEGTIETERGSDGRDDLGDEPVKVFVVGALNVQVPAADAVDGLVVDHERTVGVLEGGVGGQDGVVGLNDGGRHLGGRVDGELELALLSVVDGQTLHQQSSETGTSSTTKGVEDQETLETTAVV